MTPHMHAPPEVFAVVIAAAERAATGWPDLVTPTLARSGLNRHLLRDAALSMLAEVMGGDGASERFDELRGVIHELATHVGAGDGQVVMCLETVAAAQALADDDPGRAADVINGSDFGPLDTAAAAASFAGQSIDGWLGPERSPQFFASLRAHYGIGEP